MLVKILLMLIYNLLTFIFDITHFKINIRFKPNIINIITNKFT